MFLRPNVVWSKNLYGDFKIILYERKKYSRGQPRGGVFHMRPVNIVCLLAVLVTLIPFLKNLFQNGASVLRTEAVAQKIQNHSVFLPFVLLGILFLIRLFRFGSVPGGFNQDGAMAAVDALALSRYGTDRFGTWLPAHFEAWGYGQMSVLLSYIMVPFIRLWGLNSITARLPLLLVSTLGAWAVYRFVKELISEYAAVAVLLFLAINPWHYMQSRWAIDCNLFPHMFLTGLCFLTLGLKKKKYLYLSMVFFALCMYSYAVSFYMMPVFLLISCIMLMHAGKVSLRQVLVCILIYFGLSFPIYGTMLINALKLDTVRLPFVTMQYFPNSRRVNDMLFFSKDIGKQLLSNINAVLRVAFLQRPGAIWNSIGGFGTLYQCSAPLIPVGAAITAYLSFFAADPDRRIGFRLLFIYWLSSLFMGVCINSVNVNRINIIFYSHIIFSGIAMYYAVRSWRCAVVLLTVIYGLLYALFLHTYFTDWAMQISNIFQKNFLEAVSFAGSFDCSRYYITPDTQYRGAAGTSEILTLYELQIDALYFQGKTNEFHGRIIPYSERFVYRNPEPEELHSETDALFIVRTDILDELSADSAGLTVRNFANYSVLYHGIP